MVLCVPEDPDEWISQTADQLVMRRCAWWVALADRPPSDNESTVTVHLPLLNIFSPIALRSMIERVDQGHQP